MIKEILFHTMKYDALRGSSYIDLPLKIKNKQCCINVKNVDNKCFQWAVLSALFPVKKDAGRVEKYIGNVSRLNFKDIDFPVTENQIPKFEKQNNVSINVFGLDEKENVYPRYISEKASQSTINLLFYKNHYVWIKNFNGLVGKQYNKHKNKKYFCYRCLHGCSDNENNPNQLSIRKT